jgi:membrane protein implicated in regulation of membrane protease activity
MQGLADFYMAHPFWIWLALGALLLAAEVGTGTGWLLWPVASAAATGALVAVVPGLAVPVHIAVFAALTILSTLAAKRFLPPSSGEEGPDINDNSARLTGQTGTVVDDFAHGQGRVLVGGAEWVALSDPSEPLARGDAVVVDGLLDGARIRVRRP